MAVNKLLTWPQYDNGWDIGYQRRRYAKSNGLQGKHGIPPEEDTLENDIRGALGEAALAAMLGVPHEIGTFKRGGDVGAYEVKTPAKPKHSLIIRPGDVNHYPLDKIYVLVLPTDELMKFSIYGWIRLRHAMLPQWRRSPNNRPWAWFVPQHALFSIESLPAS